MKKSNPHKKGLGRGLENLREAETPVLEEISSSSTMIVVVASIAAFILGAASHLLFSELSPGPPKASAVSLLPSPPSSVSEGGGSSVASGSENRPSESADVVPALPPPSRFHDTVVRESIHKRFPLTPDDIKLIRKTLKETQKAVHGSPPVGRAVSVSVSLDPGAPFPDIHLVPGIATTITVVDATGAPWPIEDVIVGNQKSFPVRKLSTPNGVVVEPKNNVGWTSLALSLKGRGTPAVLRLIDSDRISDTRVTARIEARGPNAVPPVFQEPRPQISALILSFLDGIPPSSARALSVRGTKDMEAWTLGDRLFVRTHMDVLAPAWLETVSGPNGMKLYVFPKVPVITAAGDDGEMKTVELGPDAGGDG